MVHVIGKRDCELAVLRNVTLTSSRLPVCRRTPLVRMAD